MHNNFYFLRQLSASLESALKGSVISECFSQTKDELIIRFELEERSFYIRASLLPGLSCLSFPENFQRARKNSVDLFDAAVGEKVSGVRQLNNERSFSIRLSDDKDLLFKMHGNRTNIALCQQGIVSSLFRKNLTADLNITLDSLDRNIDWSREYFENHIHDLKTVYFTFGKMVWKYLEEQSFFDKSASAQWEALQFLLRNLEAPPCYYIILDEGKPVLSLVETGHLIKKWRNPIEAANDFFHFFTRDYAFSKEKAELIAALSGKLAAAERYCEKNSTRLGEVQRDQKYTLWADLIMANLHTIRPGSESVVLEDLYGGKNTVEIKLRKDVSAQKNAEIFYKKAKNRYIEIERVEASIRQKREEMDRLKQRINEVEGTADLKSLRNLKAALHEGKEAKKNTGALPYREFVFKDYRIWVGKNAQQNDVLTLKHSHKDDLWLHAKDVSGSHVLIKHQAGRNFPKEVIEFAASLAAANSKRKNETLCPVVVTPKKFVRKRKGAPHGAVVVEREDVMLVSPAR